MIGDKSAAVKNQFSSQPQTAAGRYNADAALVFTDDTFKIEVGFIDDAACYVIHAKKTGAKLSDLEVRGLLAFEAFAAPWEATVIDPNTTDFIYQEQLNQGPITRVLFAEQQARKTQLVVFSRNWRPDLKDLSASPLI